MRIKSFAKINLGLEVEKKRPDGYHEIRTLFQAINLSDSLELEEVGSGKIKLWGDDRTIPWDEKNLIFRAALLLQESYKVSRGVRIRVAKSIPAGKGLGGGSSNAAATLLALNRLWSLDLSRSELLSLAARLGADVPFFLEGGLCLGEGRGDILTPVPDLPPLYGVLFLPSLAISTAEIYARLRLTSRRKESKIRRFLTRGKIGLIDSLENTLEEPVFNLHPRLKEYKDFLLARETVLCLMSGSGSAVYGLYWEREKAERVLAEWAGPARALLFETLSRERYWKEMTAGV